MGSPSRWLAVGIALISVNAFAVPISGGPLLERLKEDAGEVPGVPNAVPAVLVASEGSEIGLASELVLPVAYQAKSRSIDVDFDAAAAECKTKDCRVPAKGFLERAYGITFSCTDNTTLDIVKQRDVYGGNLFADIPPTAGLAEQAQLPNTPAINGAIQCTLRFKEPIRRFQFVRPALKADPRSGIWFPAWRIHVFSRDEEIHSAGESGFGHGIRYYDLDKTPEDLRSKIAPYCDKGLICGRGDYPRWPFSFPAMEVKNPRKAITSVTIEGDGAGQAALTNLMLYKVTIVR